jgi:hypothetical protein
VIRKYHSPGYANYENQGLQGGTWQNIDSLPLDYLPLYGPLDITAFSSTTPVIARVV